MKYRSAIIFFFLSACTGTSVPSQTLPQMVPAASASPSPTRSAVPALPSLTPTLEASPTSPLPARGPYLAFLNGSEKSPVLNLLAPDGVGGKEIALPEGAGIGHCLKCVISPDGKLLAYRTGFAGKESHPQQPLDPKTRYDLRLNILNISDGTSTLVTGLLSQDYPANFAKNAESVQDLPDFSGMSIAEIAVFLSQSFLTGIRSAAWSPDGRYLAFAGEMDGPSSDLYVYDPAEKAIRRLSSGSKNILPGASIQWSPDGKWIVYSAGYLYGEGTTVTFYAARPDGSAFREFPEETHFLDRWISPSVFVLERTTNGSGNYASTLADLESGKSTSIWPCPLSDWDIDPEKMEILVYQFIEPKYQHCQVGLYSKNLNTGNIRRIAQLDPPEDWNNSRVLFLGMGENRYLVYQAGTGTYIVSSQGKLDLIQNADYAPVVSPDRRWVAFAGKGLRLMDAEGKISELPADRKAEQINWRPDSKGFLFNSGTDLYYVSLPTETVDPIAKDYPPIFPFQVFWRPDSEGYFFEYDWHLYYVSLQTKTMAVLRSLSDYQIDVVWVAVS